MIKNILLSIIPVLIVAILGTTFFMLSKDWFMEITKPSYWPPNFLFPLMWTVIYTLFAICIYYLLREKKITKNLVILLSVNGILNIFWCLTFFVIHNLFLSMVIILFNLIAAIYLLMELRDKFKYIDVILCIYPLWLLIATYLNAAVWILN